MAVAALVALAATTIGSASAAQGAPLSAQGRPLVTAQQQAATTKGALKTYVVVADHVAGVYWAAVAVWGLGGRVTAIDPALGTLTATSTRADFAARVSMVPGVGGVAVNQFIARLNPRTVKRASTATNGTAGTDRAAATKTQQTRSTAPRSGDEPLASHQKNLKMIHATRTGSYAVEKGRRGVLVGVLDTGIDGSHPDIGKSLDRKRSRNFVTDIPKVDGPCEHPSCVDPVDEDDNGHGTQAAGMIGAPLNKIGIGGVAPGVTLLNLRVAQDSGYVFLLPVLNALRYAADVGVDVVNMSIVIDPWVFNCWSNPKDTAVQQSEQRAILTATQRALKYAHRRGVTLVGALGNSSIDLDRPGTDQNSPTFPQEKARERPLGPDCRTLPAEGSHVIGVSSVGLSRKKAFYSNFGGRATDLSAPGGSNLDFFGTERQFDPDNVPLGPFPRKLALPNVNPKTGKSIDPSVETRCTGPGPKGCSYWRREQGTSFAAPLVTGVAALIISRYGTPDPRRPGLRMSPDRVEQRLRASATKVACPGPYVLYKLEGFAPARCTGTAQRNSIYGSGIVDALRAVKGK